MSDADPSVTAVANLLQALSTILIIDAANRGKVDIMLNMFDRLNKDTLPTGIDLDKLNQTSTFLRGMLQEMPKR